MFDITRYSSNSTFSVKGIPLPIWKLNHIRGQWEHKRLGLKKKTELLEIPIVQGYELPNSDMYDFNLEKQSLELTFTVSRPLSVCIVDVR